MKSSWWYRFSFLLFVIITSILMILPTIFDWKADESNFPIKSRVNLGLDLQGGLYMILGIDFNRVYSDEIKGYARKFEYLLKENGIASTVGEVRVPEPHDPRHTIIIANAADVEKAKDKIKEYFPGVVRLTHEAGTTLEFGIAITRKNFIEDQALSKSIEVIRNRIDEFGVTEPEIFSQGKDSIVVQLPGVKDIERAKQLIGKTAKLEFKLVGDTVPMTTLVSWVDKAEKAGVIYKKGERYSDYLQKMNDFLKDDLPKDFELAFQKHTNRVSGEVDSKIPFLVEKNTQLTGDELEDAGVQIDSQKNEPYVSMNFKSAGAKRFEEITGKNRGKRLAVILDSNVYTAPFINERIAGGRAQITLGNGQYQDLFTQAKDIALVLRAGALPVQLDFQEQRIVGPSLGADSIKAGGVSALIGCTLVFLFIMFVYKISGMIAVITLIINVLIVLACLVGIEATLTLPGIAGIALTVGMAVDGNIIIYERMREEVRKGLNYFKVVESGFTMAFWSIFDANITTALAGLCLLNFGTGPIRGFAVTLLIGIAATVYTSYYVSKILFELYMYLVRGRELSI